MKFAPCTARARPEPPADSPGPGTVIAGKYRVERVLGEGGMGVVVEATHLALGHRFAVKLLHKSLTRGPAILERFLHEARVSARLPGEHVARTVDVGETESGDPYLVMELLVGNDLGAELSSRGRLPIEEAVGYVTQACEGVAELHAVGLVHRDLKPANLFLTRRRDGTPLVKVLDFGIAKWTLDFGAEGPASGEVAAPVRTNTSCGTPSYMAPEQFHGDGVDGRCDQHALGVVLYELLAGVSPFGGETFAAIAATITLSEARPIGEIRPDVPMRLDQAIAKALSKRPDDRFPDLAAFARAIAPFGRASAMLSARNVAVILATTFLDDESLEPTLPGVRLGKRPGLRAAAGASLALAAALGIGALGMSLDASNPTAAAAARLAVAASGAAAVMSTPTIMPAVESAPTPASASAAAAPAAAPPRKAPSKPVATAPRSNTPHTAREVFGAKR